MEVVPSGKHAGKKLADVPTAALLGMHSAWSDIARLKESPFFEKIIDEVVSRGLSTVKKSVQKRIKQVESKNRTAKRLTGIVEAKCNKCGSLSRINANSWSGEGIESKPKCACVGMIYLADPSSVVVFVGETHFGKRIR